jgi:hypothetical protein
MKRGVVTTQLPHQLQGKIYDGRTNGQYVGFNGTQCPWNLPKTPKKNTAVGFRRSIPNHTKRPESKNDNHHTMQEGQNDK